MKKLISIFFGTLAFTITVNAAPQNILLIIADDYGVDSCSLYTSSGSQPPIPNLTALAQSGVLFRNAYVNPVCSPTRATLITGRYGFRTGIGDVITVSTSPKLTASEFTLPEAFAANPSLNYQLAQFGKWHLGNTATSPNNIGGWSYFAGSLIGQITSYTNWSKTVNGISTTTTNYATTDIVNDVISWTQLQGTKPWFAWVAFNAPHTPLHKPPNSLCPHYTTLSGTTQDITANSRKYFEAMVEAMDTEIGRLLATVNRTNTHIIFLGDNGTQQVVQPPYPSNRGKDTLYEGGIHIPFIVAGPAVVNPNRTNDSLVNGVDVFSTILEMAGINVASTVSTNIILDSQSFLPVLQGGANSRRYAYSEVFSASRSTNTSGQSLRNTQFKLIHFGDRDEFYDLTNDPYEASNLLTTTLTSSQQSNYYGLTLQLAGYQQTLAKPVIATASRSGNQFTLGVNYTTNLTFTLWRAPEFSDLSWSPVTNAITTTNSNTVYLTDTNATNSVEFYRVVAKSP